MNQEWNKGLFLDPLVIEKAKKMKPIDIMVGVLCKDVETTVLNVLNVINEGLYRYFPEYNMSIVVSKAKSVDNTDEAIELFQPYHNIQLIITDDITDGGKGAGVMTIFEIAHEAEAKCVILMDGDLLSIKPSWIETIANPVVYGRADLTVPYYIRDKNDGVITNNLVYPFTRSLYGIDIRQPIAGEFALSKNLYELLRQHPLFPLAGRSDVGRAPSRKGTGNDARGRPRGPDSALADPRRRGLCAGAREGDRDLGLAVRDPGVEVPLRRANLHGGDAGGARRGGNARFPGRCQSGRGAHHFPGRRQHRPRHQRKAHRPCVSRSGRQEDLFRHPVADGDRLLFPGHQHPDPE